MSLAGELRARLTLQEPVEVSDGQGGTVRTYTEKQKIWARMTPRATRESVVADAAVGLQRMHIEARSPLELSLQHRLIDGEDVYRIVSYRDDGVLVAIEAELQFS